MNEGDDFETRYAAIVGARLRAVRRQKRLSLQAVEQESSQEFKASVLGAYERGERAISVPRLQRLARLYDVPVDQLLPGDLEDEHELRDAEVDSPRRQTKIRIDLSRLRLASGPEAEALRRFLATIQVERQDFNGLVITIRRDDLRVIGATLGYGVDTMIERLDELELIQRV